MQDEPPNETLAVVAPVEVAVTEVGALGSVWKAEAEGTKRIELAAIESAVRMRRIFFILDSIFLFGSRPSARCRAS